MYLHSKVYRQLQITISVPGVKVGVLSDIDSKIGF
jgi:hypothetical protein